MVALLLLVVLVGLFLYVRRKPAVLTDLMMRQIESHYAPDVTAQDRADLRSAYREFRAAVEANRVNRNATSRLRSILSGVGSRPIDRESARQLTRVFRDAAAFSAAAPSPSLPPVPTPGPSP